MSDTTTITPIIVEAGTDPFAALQEITGEELDLLIDIGVINSTGLANRMRLPVGLGWLQLRRDHPDLSYEEGRKHVRIRFPDGDDDDGDEEEASAATVDPTGAAD